MIKISTKAKNVLLGIAIGLPALTMIDTAKAIKQIMSEKPNSWRDFIKTNN